MTIIEKRQALGMSQKELADKCEISQQFLCDIEKGRTNPSINTAIKIAQALDVDDINFFSELMTLKASE